MKKYLILLLTTIFAAGNIRAQKIQLPENINPEHPRLLTNARTGRQDLKALIDKEAWAKGTYQTIVREVEPYVIRHQSDSTWIVSRLQMYWKAHSTDVYIKNGVYAYASGKAPVPTVRFTGTRDAASAYSRPNLEDIKPYMDQDGKINLQNKSLPGQPWEWVEQSKTGRTIESINIDIITRARNAAMVYWYTGDDKYGKFAFDIFDTYLTGMYYRNEPVDLNHGHDQTLVGLSSFEVIHEDVLEPLTACYDFIYGYIEKKHREKMPVYTGAFKKWADIIIKNGVPFNNWDLIEARFVASIALVLDDDKQYSDHKGCQFYLDQILNRTYTRQWALVDLLNKGYDQNTGIWAECPGYSVGVLGDFTGFVSFFDRTLNTDFLPKMSILPEAVLAQAQYLYPNGYIVGFGDTHYGRLPTRAIEDMVRNARLYHKAAQEETYTRMLKTIKAMSMENGKPQEARKGSFNALFGSPPLVLSNLVEAGKPEDYLTATFWAPNVSWFVQRNGLDVENGLMVSQAGSSGNHAHANGIAMELYGKGIILAPEGGIGGSYFQSDYAEYYSQFPAHNTVVVDGVSAYPAMKSNHPLVLKACYPKSGQLSGYFKGVTFSDVSFLEPETNAAQNRLMGIVRTSDTSGYYVDIFRSHKKEGGDKYHDYIYHNIGQQLILTDAANDKLNLQPTDKLTFANTELMGYDYFWDKQSAKTASDFKAKFNLKITGIKEVTMNMWMKGYPGREVFSVKAPPSRSWHSNEIIPDSIANLPLPTVVVRQNGEAWNKPFAAVYEPANGINGSSISKISAFNAINTDSAFVGVLVQNKNGLNDYIMANAGNKTATYQNIKFKGTYAVVRAEGKKLNYLFLGNGYQLEQNGYGIEAVLPTSAALTFDKGQVYFTAGNPVNLSIPDTYPVNKTVKLDMEINGKKSVINGVRKIKNNKRSVLFAMPALPITKISIE